MDKLVSIVCGKDAINLRIIIRTTCENLSTYIVKKSVLSHLNVGNHPKLHYLYPLVSNQLSPTITTQSPLMNTIYTQFPQHLLLQPLKKK